MPETAGAEAYRRRQAGESWADIQASMNGKRVGDLAKRHAIRNGLPWPLHTSARLNTGGEQHGAKAFIERRARIYAMRLTGATWDEIAVKYKTSNQGALLAAMKHAWVIGKPLPTSGDLTRSKQGDSLAQVYALREKGLAWESIRKQMPRMGSDLQEAVQEYAVKNGLPWPPLAHPGKTAYELRAAGLPWTEILAQTPYSHAPGAVCGARRFAQKFGKPWPPKAPAGSNAESDT